MQHLPPNACTILFFVVLLHCLTPSDFLLIISHNIFGSQGTTRTYDSRLNRTELCQLSYLGTRLVRYNIFRTNNIIEYLFNFARNYLTVGEMVVKRTGGLEPQPLFIRQLLNHLARSNPILRHPTLFIYVMNGNKQAESLFAGRSTTELLPA